MRTISRRLPVLTCAVAIGLLSARCGPVGNTGSTSPDAGPEGGSSGGSGSGGGSGSSGGSGGSSGSGSSSGGATLPDGGGDAAAHTADGGAIMGLHVAGNHLVDGGKTVRLLGVDKSGTEYQCVNSATAIFDGPSDASLVSPMKAWGVNTVRVPLNEDCWLGINGVAAAVGGTSYQQAIAAYVQTIRANGMYVIVDLHWNAPGTTLATAQQPMPDADHAEQFWISVAGAFKSDQGILFDLYNEPFPNEQNPQDPGPCWLNGCSLSDWKGYSGAAMAVGFQQLVNDVRNVAGATNVIMAGGWAYASDLSGWLANEPKDPLGNLAASFHTYNFTGCNTASCWTDTVGQVAAVVPVVTGELGENDCAATYVDSFFAWADPLGISYLGWAWNTASCGSFPSLITSYTGTPTAFGQAFMAHLPTQ